jgi:hypothetical protein
MLFFKINTALFFEKKSLERRQPWMIKTEVAKVFDVSGTVVCFLG